MVTVTTLCGPRRTARAVVLAAALVALLAAEAAAAAAADPLRTHIHSLDGDGWTLFNKARGIRVGGSVPGGVYSDLRAAGQLPEDLFYRFNDLEYRWVGNDNWTYERSFQVRREAVHRDKQVLVLHGVDTLADVLLNGRLLGSVDNMFVRHRFDVKGVLEDGPNLLEVRFSSPVGEARRRAAEQAKQYPVPPACPPSVYNGECSVNHLRKMQASFAWDWGPAFPSMGLWKSVHLESYDEAVLRELGFKAWASAASWRALVRVYWERGVAAPPLQGPAERASVGHLELSLAAPDGTVILSKDTPVTMVADEEGAGYTDVPIAVPNHLVELWWPSGYGGQPLYRLNVTLRALGLRRPGQQRDDHRDHLSVRVGFRNISLVQEEVRPGDPSKGLTFYVRVNGVPVFAKGSNWVPSHVLPERGADPDVVAHLLHSAKEANMNMVRVWGGGVYESDLFYQLADELGIMVWQDMMFACAMYPVGEAFLRSVDREARQQYRRLHHHASVALWAGNNENEAALRGNWYGTAGARFDLYHRDYVKLYVDTVRAALRDEGSKAPFVVSSPSNMAESEQEGFVARNPYSSLYGDDHHYDYLSDAWNPAVFHHTRFGSEFGFMSWPVRATMQSATDRQHTDEDLALGSRLAHHRQHHPGGNEEMALQIRQHMALPDDYKDARHYDDFAYKSQVYQAMATKAETEFYRRSRNLLTPVGEGRTMGALYWMLNDVWQAPSWSSIDFDGRWKMLHYAAVNFLAPLLVSPFLDGDVLNVDVVSDEDRQDELLAHIEVLPWGSFSAAKTERVVALRLAGAGSTLRAWSGPLRPLLEEAGCGAPGSCYVRTRLTTLDNATILADNGLPIGPLKGGALGTLTGANVQIAGVEGPFAGTQRQPWDFVVRVTSSAPAAFVWLDAGPLRGRFSRNGFHLFEAGLVDVRFHSQDLVSLARFNRHISVRSLAD